MSEPVRSTEPLTEPEVGKSGRWLAESTAPADVFTPEKLTEEHRLIARTAADFVDHEVLPALDRLNAKDWPCLRALVRRCGDLGLLGVNAPEEYGGVALDKVSSLIVSQHLSEPASFAAAVGAQVNLCIVPILMFGTPGQKERYLPRLVTGEWLGAYALSESGAGSDALSCRTIARRQADGSYLLSGEKMWITNGGVADVMIVFGKVDGDLFSAFIVERAFGVLSGSEEHKMGLHGSSTTPLVLNDVRVPAENVLGEVGKGHRVAFDVLNFGRFKLGAMCLGTCQVVIAEAAKYAAARRQFGQAIAAFGAIRHKLGEMTARTYALESLMYRTAGSIDAYVQEAAGERSRSLRAALEEFAVEASVAKVFGSEVLDFVADENVQVHGGNGFVHDYPAERHYRDARVNRIFEGTNEINRLLIPALLMKRAQAGDPVLFEPDSGAAATSATDAPMEGATSGSTRPESLAVEAFRRTARLVARSAAARFGAALRDEQEVMLWLADIAIETFAAESAVLRAEACLVGGQPSAALHSYAARVFVHGAALRIESAAREALSAACPADAAQPALARLRAILDLQSFDTVAARRALADAAVNAGRYPFA